MEPTISNTTRFLDATLNKVNNHILDNAGRDCRLCVYSHAGLTVQLAPFGPAYLMPAMIPSQLVDYIAVGAEILYCLGLVLSQLVLQRSVISM